MKWLFFCCIFSMLSWTAMQAQSLPSGPQVLTFHSPIDDTEQPYALYLPENYDPAKQYPLVMMLHGAGSNHRLALRRVFGKSNANGETDVEASRYFPEWAPQEYIVVSPYARGTIGYQGVAEKDVMAVLADVKERFSIDENRTYLTGLSMGGGGTLWLGLKYPDLWAAIAPVCPAPPPAAMSLMRNATNYPVKLFQGGADPVVSPVGVKVWRDGFEQLGVNVEYVEYPGVGHDSWVPAYKEAHIFEWFSQFERNPYPTTIQFATESYQSTRAWWANILRFTPGERAELEAVFTGPNKLSIRTHHIQVLTLELEGHPQYQAGKKIQLIVNGQKLKIAGDHSLVLLGKLNGEWTDKMVLPQGVQKQAGLEGPMADALSDRHIYVYGTADNPDEATLTARRQQAEKAANWSFYRGEFMGRIMIFPRVLSDKQVRESDHQASHLILFGDAATNAIIAELADELPVQLTTEDEAVGLAYVFPHGNRYVLINSGLSVLEAPNPEGVEAEMAWLGLPPITRIALYQDLVLYDKDKVLVNSRFDQEWRLSEQTKKSLQESGQVEVK